jgi:hypothetical protein
MLKKSFRLFFVVAAAAAAAAGRQFDMRGRTGEKNTKDRN